MPGEDNPWYLASGYGIGSSHPAAGLPCQDRAISKTANGVRVIAVSDGCSESFISELGSETTVNTLAAFFTEHFDELTTITPFEFKKRVMKEVYSSLDKCLIDSKERIDEYIKAYDNDYQDFLTRKDVLSLGYRDNDRLFRIRLLNATIIFAAVKDNIMLLGRLGDGFIGTLKDGHMSLTSEEEKTGATNATIYPSSYIKAYEDDPNCSYPKFWIGKSTNASSIDGVILLSDGCDALISISPFQKKFALGAKTLFGLTVNDDPNKQKADIDAFVDRLVKRSRTFDDCGIAVLARKNWHLEDFVVKNEPRQVEEPKEPETAAAEAPIVTPEPAPTPRKVKIPEPAPETEENVPPSPLMSFYPSKDEAKELTKTANIIMGFIKANDRTTKEEIATVLKLDPSLVMQCVNNLYHDKRIAILPNGKIRVAVIGIVWKKRK
jgi:hypothetical protein